jgi:hypothetical protein
MGIHRGIDLSPGMNGRSISSSDSTPMTNQTYASALEPNGYCASSLNGGIWYQNE